jgi:hypothetical protein
MKSGRPTVAKFGIAPIGVPRSDAREADGTATTASVSSTTTSGLRMTVR